MTESEAVGSHPIYYIARNRPHTLWNEVLLIAHPLVHKKVARHERSRLVLVYTQYSTHTLYIE